MERSLQWNTNTFFDSYLNTLFFTYVSACFAQTISPRRSTIEENEETPWYRIGAKIANLLEAIKGIIQFYVLSLKRD